MQNNLFILFLFIVFYAKGQDLNTTNIDSTVVFFQPEIMPIYSGCKNNFDDNSWDCSIVEIKKYLQNAPIPIKYQQVCFEAKIFISFIVEIDGRVTNVKLLKGFEEKLNEAALNHVKKMPKFETSEYENNVQVRTQVNVPVIYKY